LILSTTVIGKVFLMETVIGKVVNCQSGNYIETTHLFPTPTFHPIIIIQETLVKHKINNNPIYTPKS
jgi:hypothetical protein